MSNLFYKIKRDKVLLALVVMLILTAILDIIIAIFDVVQLVKVSAEPTALSSVFFGLNVCVSIFNVISLVFILFYIVLKHVKISSKSDKK